eukprot:scaffold67578_cov83-Phaeocystis_antarctica.AAC.1
MDAIPRPERSMVHVMRMSPNCAMDFGLTIFSGGTALYCVSPSAKSGGSIEATCEMRVRTTLPASTAQ